MKILFLRRTDFPFCPVVAEKGSARELASRPFHPKVIKEDQLGKSNPFSPSRLTAAEGKDEGGICSGKKYDPGKR